MKTSIATYGLISNLGRGKEEHSQKLFNPCKQEEVLTATEINARPAYIGKISTELCLLEEDNKLYNSRNNRLLLTVFKEIESAVQKAISQFGRERIGIVIGTSTSGVAEAEQAFEYHLNHEKFPADYDYKQHEMGSPAEFLASYLDLEGPAYTVSCACSSGAKSLAAADRLIQSGICDAVIAGGVDTLCHLTLNGFRSLEVMSETFCNPFSYNRSGINIGEAGALFLLSKEPGKLQLLGYGESSDAHHQSAPHPEGLGAETSMQQALKMAGISPNDLTYINLHGTGTRQNDSMEAKAVYRLIGNQVSCSSTKALTGHTLGAAGALEAAFCCLAMEHGQLPVQLWDQKSDPDIPKLAFVNSSQSFNSADCAVMSNSFAFGGNNCSLILGTKT